MVIVETVFVGLVTSVIHDILKCFVAPIEHNKRKTTVAAKEIVSFLNEKEIAQFDTLFNSGLFQEYIESPQVCDVIYNYAVTIQSHGKSGIKTTENADKTRKSNRKMPRDSVPSVVNSLGFIDRLNSYNQTIKIVLDSAGYQQCKTVKDFAPLHGIELLFPPAYSPDL
ncbi:MAG: hypothetical protein LBG27_07100, partial [Spirochaetaceae bacterium]|nr:hypothetical protein [Spirochaetaceae bacterium]